MGYTEEVLPRGEGGVVGGQVCMSVCLYALLRVPVCGVGSVCVRGLSVFVRGEGWEGTGDVLPNNIIT